MEFVNNSIIEVESVPVVDCTEALNVEAVPNIQKVALLNGIIVPVWDEDTIADLAERETIKKYALKENNVTHVEPFSLRMRRSMCEYTGQTENVHEVYLPYDRLTGIMCSQENVANAVRDCISYCEKNCIFPMNNLAQFMEERGFKYFKVLRTSGEIAENWQIEQSDELVTTEMPELHGGGCGIFLAVNMETPDYLHKHVSVDRLCKMNNISSELKEEMLNYLKLQLHNYYNVYLQ